MEINAALTTIKNRVTWENIADSSLFFLIHLACLSAFWVGLDRRAVILCALSFLVRKVGITGGYHRYFSHRSYKTGRVFQFLLAWIGCSATQKGPLWWAGHHRFHHQHADTELDLHSPARHGVWWSHIGWFISGKYDATNFKIIPDFARFPELRWLNRNFLVPPVALAAACFLIGGWRGLVWGYFVSTTILWHTTFLINSACHLWGRRRFPTRDTSRNNGVLAALTMGEGWHNNHHYYPSSVNQGFYWWELDVTYYVLRVLSWLGLVWDLRVPPARILEFGRRLEHGAV